MTSFAAFGPSPSIAALTAALSGKPTPYESLVLAHKWWAENEEAGTLDTYSNAIIRCTLDCLEAQCADDLFGSATLDRGEAVLQLVGVTLQKSQRSKARQPVGLGGMGGSAASVLGFVKRLGQADKSLVRSAVVNAFEFLSEWAVNRLPDDQMDQTTSALLRDRKERGLAALVGFALENEIRDAIGTMSPGTMEQNAVLRGLLQHSTVPCFDLFQPARYGLGSSNPTVLDYFLHLSNFPRVMHRDLDLQNNMLRNSMYMLQDTARDLLQRALRANREGVQAWLGHTINVNVAQLKKLDRNSIVRDWEATCATSGYLLNIVSVVLLLFHPLTQKPEADMFPKIDWSYVCEDWRINFSSEPKLNTQVTAGEEGGAGGVDDGGDSGGEDQEDQDVDMEEAAELKAALELSMRPHADPGFFPDGHDKNYNFITEIFWMASKAVALIQHLKYRFDEQRSYLHHILEDTKRAHQVSSPGASQFNSPVDEAEKRLMQHIFGWEAHLFDLRLITNALHWANFTAHWLISQSHQPNAAERFARFPASMVKAMCDIWGFAATMRGAENYFTAKQAIEAAIFCCEFMQKPDLMSSPIVQAKLVDVVVVFQQTSGPAAAAASSGSPLVSPSKYFGSNRGFAGAVMDTQRIREELAPALMKLYADVHAVEGLDVDADTGFDKFSVRHRVNSILVDLYGHPLHEPRVSIVKFAEGPDFEPFVIAAFDTIMYNFHDVLERISDGCRLEAQFNGEAPPVGHPQYHFYASQQRTSRGFMHHNNSTWTMLSTLMGETRIAEKLALGSLGARTAALIISIVAALCSPDRQQHLAVNKPKEWGFDMQVSVERATSLLLACVAQAPAFAGLVGAHPDFELVDFEAAAATPGGSLLVPVVEQLRAQHARSSSAAADVQIAWESAGLADLMDAGALEGLVTQYEEDCSDFSFDMVEEFQGGHYFDKKRGESVHNMKALVKEVKRMPRLLPAPHPDGSIFVQFHESALNFARAVVSGPAGTPYYGGLFVFDVYFPSSYPNDAPLVQLVTTGQGTTRFNPNLYADGKVCLSVLGTWHGHESEKWQPGVSSLYQVLMSIQGQILVPSPYFNEPGRESQQGTEEGRQGSLLYNQELRLAAIRHAMIAQLRNPIAGLRPLIHAHFQNVKPMLLASLKADLDQAAGTPVFTKFQRAVRDLISELDALCSDE